MAGSGSRRPRTRFSSRSAARSPPRLPSVRPGMSSTPAHWSPHGGGLRYPRGGGGGPLVLSANRSRPASVPPPRAITDTITCSSMGTLSVTGRRSWQTRWRGATSDWRTTTRPPPVPSRSGGSSGGQRADHRRQAAALRGGGGTVRIRVGHRRARAARVSGRVSGRTVGQTSRTGTHDDRGSLP